MKKKKSLRKKKRMLKTIIFILLKLTFLMIIIDLTGEYVINRPVPHFIQVLVIFGLVIIMAVTFKSIYKTIINLKNKKQ